MLVLFLKKMIYYEATLNYVTFLLIIIKILTFYTS